MSRTLSSSWSVGTALVVAPVLALLATSCHELESLGASQTTVTAADSAWVQKEDAALRIRNARCAREVACENVGEGHLFPKLDACLAEYEQTSKGFLESCRGGIAGGQLTRCEEVLRSMSCGAVLADLNTVTACRVANMCIRP